METNYLDGWNKRKILYEDVHNVKKEDLECLAKALDFKSGDSFVDLMCGYGAVTQAVLNYCTDRKIQLKQYFLIDLSEEQLERVDLNLRKINLETHYDPPSYKMCEDVRSLSLNSYFSKAAIKMGVHEVPRKDQYKVISEAYRILKPKGKIAVWDLMFKTKLEQLVFQRTVQEKDRLAGFSSLAINRYLPREDELRDYLEKAGFKEIEFVKEIPYNFSTEKRLHAELGGDESKLEEWNEFIRAIVPDEVKESIQYQDKGRTIEAVFRKGILAAVK